jgi:hypothetical protein
MKNLTATGSFAIKSPKISSYVIQEQQGLYINTFIFCTVVSEDIAPLDNTLQNQIDDMYFHKKRKMWAQWCSYLRSYIVEGPGPRW